MLTQLRKRKEGFTIIEVLIVLAIAGLILLVVFLAVPALQRNSRNTQRKNDVAALLGSVSEYVNNNAGQLPTTAAQITDNAKLGFYETGNISLTTGSAGTDKNSVYVVKGAKCSGNTLDTAAATSRNVAAIYFVETSSSTTQQCQAS